MSGKPAARVSDPTACPVPGHGTNPIAAGSGDVFFDGLPAARKSDPSACGGALSGALIGNVLINGKPAAVVGSVGSHGNVVIGGSGTVIIGNSVTTAAFEPPAPLKIAAAIVAAASSPAALLDAHPLAAKGHSFAQRSEQKLEEEEEEEELPVQQGITLRIGVFFDGTGNNLANAAVTEQCRRDDLQQLDERTLAEVVDYCERNDFTVSEESTHFERSSNDSYGNAPSNVARLFDLYADDAIRMLRKEERSANIKAYLEGIGTSSGEPDSIYGQATGTGETGILARVAQSPAAIMEQFRLFQGSNPDVLIDTLEFDIFGFSRGAAAARHFANEILKPQGGLLAKLFNAQSPGFNPDFDWASRAQINFIGLFDTVAGVVSVADGDFSAADNINPGINLYLPPGCARKVLQLTARDEKRWNFALNSVAPDHQEISLPGSHSDIGGGYRPVMSEKLVLSRPLSSRVPADTPVEHTYARRETQRQYAKWGALGLPGQGILQPRIWINRLHRFQNHGVQHPPEDLVSAAVVIARQVRGELALVYLRVMRELAMGYGVPFDFIDEQEKATAIPADLTGISQKLITLSQRGTAPLTQDEERLLWSRYIHLSANWTPNYGFMINKPAPNTRLAYNNKPQQSYPQ